MSLINDMLRNLEQRHAAEAPLPNEVRPLPQQRSGLPWRPVAAGLAVLAAGAAGYVALRDKTGAASPAPPPVVTAAAAIATPSAAPAPAPSAPTPPAAVAEAVSPSPAPRVSAGLQLDTSLPSLDRLVSRDEKPAPPLPPPASKSKPPVAPSAPAAAPLTAPAPPQPAAHAIEKPAEPDPRVQAEADMRSARDLIAQGRRAEAEQSLRQALARAPALTDAAMTLARLQVDRGDLAGAWETLQRGLPFGQQQAAYQAFCGTVLQRLNRSREAVDHYQAALRLNPAEGRWWVGLGLALEGAGKATEAREAFQRGRAAGNLPPEMAAFAEQKSR